MPDSFLHGVEVVEFDHGPRPVRTVRSSVIGVVGTAPGADAEAFPMDTPVLVAGSRRGAARLGETGALPDALVSIFDQVGAMVVVIRVAEGSDNSDTRANVIGGVGADTDAYTVPYPAEHITFRSMMTDGYMEELTTTNRLPPSAKRPGALAVATLRADNLPDDGIAPSPAEIRYPHRYPLCYPPRTDF